MLESKRKRGPTRTPQEKLEDQFMDLSIAEQVKALATFQTLHRMKIRLTDQSKPLVQPMASTTDADRERGEWMRCAFTPEFAEPLKCTYCGRFEAEHMNGRSVLLKPETSQGSLIDEIATETGTKGQVR